MIFRIQLFFAYDIRKGTVLNGFSTRVFFKTASTFYRTYLIYIGMDFWRSSSPIPQRK